MLEIHALARADLGSFLHMGGLILSFSHAGIVRIEEDEISYRMEQIASSDNHNHEDALVPIDSLPNHLTERTVIVFDSVFSGEKQKRKNVYEGILKPLFLLLNIRHRYIRTTTSHTISDNAAKLEISKSYLIIMISGDTSLNELINAMSKGMDVAVLMMIQGTGNAFANSIGLGSVFDAVRALFIGKLSYFPLYEAKFEPPGVLINEKQQQTRKVNQMLFFVVGSWGLHASLVAESASLTMRAKYGNERFKKAAESILQKNPAFLGSITLLRKNGERQVIEDNQPFSYFIMSAMPKFEASFLISPKSDPSKSELHLLYFRHTKASTTMKLMDKAYNNGIHIEDPLVKYIRINDGQSVELAVSDSVYDPACSKICLDGSIVLLQGIHRKITFSCSSANSLLYLK